MTGGLLDDHDLLGFESNFELGVRFGDRVGPGGVGKRDDELIPFAREIALVRPLSVDSNLAVLEQAARSFAPETRNDSHHELVETLAGLRRFDAKPLLGHLGAPIKTNNAQRREQEDGKTGRILLVFFHTKSSRLPVFL